MENKETNRQQAQSDSENVAINKGEQHIGRAGHEETHDISHVDQQEGKMNNGVLGGNFSNSDESSENDGQK